MAAPKQSARQLADAALTTHSEGKRIDTGPTPRRIPGSKPEGFKGDRKGYFRGARVRA